MRWRLLIVRLYEIYLQHLTEPGVRTWPCRIFLQTPPLHMTHKNWDKNLGCFLVARAFYVAPARDLATSGSHRRLLCARLFALNEAFGNTRAFPGLKHAHTGWNNASTRTELRTTSAKQRRAICSKQDEKYYLTREEKRRIHYINYGINDLFNC